MDAIFMNLENSRTSEYHVLVLKLTDKLDLRRGQKSIALSKAYTITINLKSLLQHVAMHLNYQIYHT